MQTVSHSLRDTRRFAGDVLDMLKKSASDDGATVLTLSGPLGSGKTALTKCIADILGVRGVITSPTFILRSDYNTDDPVFSSLIHIDAYRLSGDEVGTVGWDDMLTSPRTLVVLEWPEHVVSSIPPRHWSVAVGAEGTVHTFSFSSPVAVQHHHDYIP